MRGEALLAGRGGLWVAEVGPGDLPGDADVPPRVVPQIGPDDVYLVLATDGLWDELRNEEVVDILQRMHSPSSHISTITRYISGNTGKSPVESGEQQFEGPNHIVTRASLRNGLNYDNSMERNAGQRLLWGALLQNPVSRRYGVQYLTQVVSPLPLLPARRRVCVHAGTGSDVR